MTSDRTDTGPQAAQRVGSPPAPSQSTAPASQAPSTTVLASKVPATGDRRIVVVAGQRRIALATYGAAGGYPVLALHGTPGSRLKFTTTHDDAGRLGLEVVAPDRWGYGGTDPHPAPTLAAFADEMHGLMASLGHRHFAVLGVSGGGPYATAVAARYAAAVSALALVAPVGPIAGEPDSEIGRFHRFCFGALAARPRATRAVFRTFRRIIRASPALGLKLAMARLPRADRKVLASPGVAPRLAQTFAEGMQPGPEGPVCDLTLFGRPWALALANAQVPARLWLGTADGNVPLSAARRLAARLPSCELVELPGAGHLWVALHYADVLGWIAETTKGAIKVTPGGPSRS